MNRTFFACIVFFAGAFSFAEENASKLSGMLPLKTATELAEKGFIQRTNYRNPAEVLELAPDSALAREAGSFWQGERPAFFSETVYLYAKPTGKPNTVGEDISRISAILRSLSRLEGIEYFSTSRNRMRTLYASSFEVAGPDNRIEIPDQTAGSADGKLIWALQKDLTFGEYLYRYDYRQTEDSVAFYSKNVDALKYTVFTLISPERLKVSLVVQDLGTHLLIYSLTQADFLSIPGIEGKLNASFKTRAEALYRWFINEYERS